jgi:hypothetical protein
MRAFATMPRLRVIDGTKPPDTPAQRVRERVRKVAVPHLPSCRSCGGHETITASVGKTKNKLCVVCLLQGRRVVIE